jgi:DNA polymerase III subunit delta
MELDYSRISEAGFPQPAALVYLFVGSDDALKREAVQRLIEPLLDPSSSDFDREDLDIGLTPIVDSSWTTRILSSAAGMPMFSERRIVVVTNVQRLAKEEQEALAAGVGRICDRSCLVLVAGTPEYDAGRVKARTAIGPKLQAAVAKAGVVVTCDVAAAGDLKARAAAYVRRFGKTAEPAALDVVVQRAVAAAADRGGAGKGGDLNVLTNELDKTIAYAGERTQISRADALAVGVRGAEENIFAMLDAVGRRDATAAMKQIEEMMRCGDKPDGVAARSFVMLGRHLRMLWGAKYLAERKVGAGFKGALPPDLQGELTGELQGLATRQSYLLRSLQDQARRWTYDQLRSGLARVLASDMTMKGIPPIKPVGYYGDAGEDPAANLRVLVVELCTHV